MTADGRTYRTAEFAALAGVTVRALRHYNRLGLLQPRRNGAGYRVYTARDLEALEQIVALKFIGLPLREIRRIRSAAPAALVDVLRAQRGTLERKRAALDGAIRAIGQAEAALRDNGAVDTAVYRTIIEAIQMHQDDEAWARQYRALLETKIAKLKEIPIDARLALREQWKTLVGEITLALDEDPASPKAQAFADRWTALMARVTGAIDPAWTAFLREPGQMENLRRFTKDLPAEERARAEAQWKDVADTRVRDFIQRALAARKGKSE